MSQSLDRGLQIMLEVAAGKSTLNELAEALGVHKSTVLRLLRTLEDYRFVQRDGAHHYRLGGKLFDLSTQALEQRDIRRIAAPFLTELNVKLGHTLHLATYEGGEAVYVDKYDSRHNVRMYSRIGKTAGLHCTAVGKVLVAYLPDAERERVIGELDFVVRTENTIRDAAAYTAELEVVRRQGYALDRAENESFVTCIAAPVRDASGDVIAAVSISVPVMMLNGDSIVAMLPDLVETTTAISAACGWTGPSGRDDAVDAMPRPRPALAVE
jgi:DNA-binding IclR family transcriptional regulator